MLRKRETQRQREEENFMVDGESMTLEVTLKKTDENPVLELVGRIVDADVKSFREKLSSYTRKTQTDSCGCKLCQFPDSHGLGTIVLSYPDAERKKGTHYTQCQP